MMFVIVVRWQPRAMSPSNQRFSPFAAVGVLVFVVLAVLIAVFLDAPTSVWLLVAMAAVALAAGGFYGSRSSRQKT